MRSLALMLREMRTMPSSREGFVVADVRTFIEVEPDTHDAEWVE
jgi:hypothetical protein